MRTAARIAVLAALGCRVPASEATDGASRPADPVVSPATPVAPPPDDVTLDDELAAGAVHHDDFVRRVLYTWTTAEQAAALRASRRLLVAEASTGDGPTPFNRGLADLVQRKAAGHEAAALLLEHPVLRKRRYAWTRPFATVLGLGPRRYGDVLVRVELDPSAILGVFRPAAAEPFAFVDMSSRPVPLAAALADPGRIAAFYHVRDDAAEEIAYREYVLCNESRIAAWSLATPEIAAAVAREVALLEHLRTGPFAQLPEVAVRTPAAPAWTAARERPTALDRWHANLAFDNTRYRPSPGNLAAIAAALREYDGSGEPLTHRPSLSF